MSICGNVKESVKFVCDGMDLDVCRLGIIPWPHVSFHEPMTKSNVSEIGKTKCLRFCVWVLKTSKLLRKGVGALPCDVVKLVIQCLKTEFTNTDWESWNYCGWVFGDLFNEKSSLSLGKEFAVLEWVSRRLYIEEHVSHNLQPTNDSTVCYPVCPFTGKTKKLPDDYAPCLGKVERIKKYERRGYLIAEFPSRAQFLMPNVQDVEMVVKRHKNF